MFEGRATERRERGREWEMKEERREGRMKVNQEVRVNWSRLRLKYLPMDCVLCFLIWQVSPRVSRLYPAKFPRWRYIMRLWMFYSLQREKSRPIETTIARLWRWGSTDTRYHTWLRLSFGGPSVDALLIRHRPHNPIKVYLVCSFRTVTRKVLATSILWDSQDTECFVKIYDLVLLAALKIWWIIQSRILHVSYYYCYKISRITAIAIRRSKIDYICSRCSCHGDVSLIAILVRNSQLF